MVSLKETKIRSKKRGEEELKRLSVEKILRREIPEEEEKNDVNSFSF